MKVSQGDIVEVVFPAPGKSKNHPVIVVSNNELIESEEAFIAVMISSTAPIDEYTFQLESHMFSVPMKKQCQARCHLISIFSNYEVIKKHGFIKKEFLNKVIEKIKYSVF